MAVDASHPSGSHRFTLIGADGAPYLSRVRGTLGGHRRSKVVGRLDCPAALRAIARGGYVGQRVFFVDADTANSAGYRPCATCMPAAYREWKTNVRTGAKRPVVLRVSLVIKPKVPAEALTRQPGQKASSWAQ